MRAVKENAQDCDQDDDADDINRQLLRLMQPQQPAPLPVLPHVSSDTGNQALEIGYLGSPGSRESVFRRLLAALAACSGISRPCLHGAWDQEKHHGARLALKANESVKATRNKYRTHIACYRIQYLAGQGASDLNLKTQNLLGSLFVVSAPVRSRTGIILRSHSVVPLVDGCPRKHSA